MSLRGKRSRLWLQLRRSELEAAYLEHQVAQLRRLHHGEAFKVHWDRIATNAIYDDVRAMFACEALWPAYHLLYPRDQFVLGAAALAQTGLIGLACLWADHGDRWNQVAKLPIYQVQATDAEVGDWLTSLGLPGRIGTATNTPGRTITWEKRQVFPLAAKLKPLLHRSLKHRLRPRDSGARSFYAGA